MTHAGHAVPIPNSRCWKLAALTASLAAAGSLTAVMFRSNIYGAETALLADAVIAQDVVTALVVFPLIVTIARRAAVGSARAHLAGLGAVAFLLYNYAIYCFSVSFGPLFLLWTSVLALSAYTLVTGLLEAVQTDLIMVVRPSKLAVGVLIGVSVIFAALWLSEIIPDLLHGRASTSAAKWNVPTNPVHVLDLAFLLPAAFLTGARLHAHSRVALAAAPGMLVLFALTCLPILVTPLVTSMRHDHPEWGAVGPIFVIGAFTLWALQSVLSTKQASFGRAPQPR